MMGYPRKVGEAAVDLTHEEQTNKGAFGPHGECLAIGSGDKTARVCDWAGGEEEATRMTHDGVVNDV